MEDSAGGRTRRPRPRPAPPRLDPAQAEALLAQAGIAALVEEVEPAPGGQVSWTYRLATADAGSLMLRLLPRGAAPLARELEAQAAAGEVMPVPEVQGALAAGELPPGWVGPWLPGRRLDEWWPGAGDDARGRAAASLGRALARLHALPPPAASTRLRRAPEPGAQLARWLGEERVPRRLGTARAARLRAAWEALPPLEVVPARRLHGDFSAGNLLLSEDGALAGVLDWEWACLGDPARDLATLLDREWRAPAAFAAGVLEGYAGADPSLPDRLRRHALVLQAELLKLAPEPSARARARARIDELLAVLEGGTPG